MSCGCMASFAGSASALKPPAAVPPDGARIVRRRERMRRLRGGRSAVNSSTPSSPRRASGALSKQGEGE